MPNEFEPTNAITFGLTLRQYIQERTTNFKFMFRVYCRVA